MVDDMISTEVDLAIEQITPLAEEHLGLPYTSTTHIRPDGSFRVLFTAPPDKKVDNEPIKIEEDEINVDTSEDDMHAKVVRYNSSDDKNRVYYEEVQNLGLKRGLHAQNYQDVIPVISEKIGTVSYKSDEQ